MPAQVFVGSSTESLFVARKIQRLLSSRDVVVKVWDSVIGPSEFLLDGLIRAADHFDFAVFVFAPDDVAHIRAHEVPAVRDNVIFETGLFIKSLGRERTFVVLPNLAGRERVHVLSDFLGLNLIHYENIDDPNDWDGRIGPACDKIRDQINHAISHLPGRAAALVGHWSGEMRQAYARDETVETFMAEATFGFSIGLVRGVFRIEGNIAPKVHHLKTNLRGSFLYESFLRLDYRYDDQSAAISFGTAMLHLNARGTKLNGHYFGYGDYSERLVSGTVTLDKVLSA
jgi:Predicted nucleotide-binding protein containing TIR-like domain